MITKTLTGRIRHRTHTSFLNDPMLVLHVEEHRKGYLPFPEGYDVDTKVWRDATSADLLTGEIKLDRIPEV